MTSRCEITGLSESDSKMFEYLHAFLIGDLEINRPDSQTLAGFSKPLLNTVSSNTTHKGELKRREGLFNHLEKSIASKFKNSKLSVFGSAESGLSIKGGDYDLCLQIPDADQKKVVKKIGSMLRGQGMEEVQVLTRAKVPIVKFIDPRSGVPVDISINNSLAIHNTNLLKTYSNLDERVKQLTLCVKHWAYHRNISDAPNGTLSSYAWSILVISHLQKKQVVPNLQNGDSRTLIEIEGKEYDLTINESAVLESKSDASIEELALSFFTEFATYKWSDSVISIRNGEDLSRDQKGWMYEEPTALDVVNSEKDEPPRMGEHHLAIEDPFDLDHDLSRVVRAVGELKIRDELLRAAVMFGKGSTWKEICQTVDPDRMKNLQPEDLFHDLRNKSDNDVKNMLAKVKGEMDALTTRVEALESERQSAIRMAKAMRGVIEETADLRKEHKAVISGLKERNKQINSVKEARDKINQDVILPIHMIEDELSKVYKRLTEEVDIHRVPSLEREKIQFSWFLELQAMHGKAREASELHQRFIELVGQQKEEIKKLKLYETQHDEATSLVIENEPLLKDKDINKNEARSYDRRVQNLQKALRQRRSDLHKLRRESGRLEAWLRKKSSGDSTRRGNRKKSGRGKTPKQDNTGPITLGDISGLLSGISSEPTPKKSRKVSSKKAGMRKLGNLGAHRGSRSQYKKKE